MIIKLQRHHYASLCIQTKMSCLSPLPFILRSFTCALTNLPPSPAGWPTPKSKSRYTEKFLQRKSLWMGLRSPIIPLKASSSKTPVQNIKEHITARPTAPPKPLRKYPPNTSCCMWRVRGEHTCTVVLLNSQDTHFVMHFPFCST